jgi:23S rRNA (cytidine1920-2'-O)/16S rRNA (cytidine1409-2'-O)-methyltransferase
VPKVRLDQLLVSRGLAPTRTRAQALLLAGRVYVDGARRDKAGDRVAEDVAIDVKGSDQPYVSRGGVKLAGALDAFRVDVSGLRCLDIGASTGGFTDCLLQRGAASVVAVDVGYGQIAQKLREDPRVVLLERTNARTLEQGTIGGAVDLTVVDASFIAIATLMPAIAACTRASGHLVALVKPQFEVGRRAVSKGRGVVRDDDLREQAIDNAAAAVAAAGFEVLGRCDSVLRGPKGNLEAFVHARRAHHGGRMPRPPL